MNFFFLLVEKLDEIFAFTPDLENPVKLDEEEESKGSNPDDLASKNTSTQAPATQK